MSSTSQSPEEQCWLGGGRVCGGAPGLGLQHSGQWLPLFCLLKSRVRVLWVWQFEQGSQLAGGKRWVSGHQLGKGGTWAEDVKVRLWGPPLCACTGLGAAHRCLEG